MERSWPDYLRAPGGLIIDTHVDGVSRRAPPQATVWSAGRQEPAQALEQTLEKWTVTAVH